MRSPVIAGELVARAITSATAMATEHSELTGDPFNPPRIDASPDASALTFTAPSPTGIPYRWWATLGAEDQITFGNYIGARRWWEPAFFIGQNDLFPIGFSADVFTLFADWEPSDRKPGDGDWRNDDDLGRLTSLQRAIGLGERIFNTRSFVISNVPGINSAQSNVLYNSFDPLAEKRIIGTCDVCHNTPNVGNHSTPVIINTGVSAASRFADRSQTVSSIVDIRNLPNYTLTSSSGRVVRVTDPGRALITGQWTDIW